MPLYLPQAHHRIAFEIVPTPRRSRSALNPPLKLKLPPSARAKNRTRTTRLPWLASAKFPRAPCRTPYHTADKTRVNSQFHRTYISDAEPGRIPHQRNRNSETPRRQTPHPRPTPSPSRLASPLLSRIPRTRDRWRYHPSFLHLRHRRLEISLNRTRPASRARGSQSTPTPTPLAQLHRLSPRARSPAQSQTRVTWYDARVLPRTTLAGARRTPGRRNTRCDSPARG
mmetsp:Transcript_1477/g.3249  ORF Transcript_1477/g.3249 Transcript_1477/m.3249 type:complete len:227 (-) Transcript_1477:42-722(-)